MGLNLEQMVERYIVTSAVYGAPANHKQLDAYEQYAKEWDADILVIPVEGQYRDEPLADRVQQYRCVTDMDLNHNLSIKDFRVRAQSINPLTGMRRFGSVDKSIILGSPKQHLEYVANSPANKPKAIMSTGACTLPKYKDHLRIGRIAYEDHKQGAVLVEVEDDKTFHFRQVQNNTDGTFIDLGVKYHPNKKSSFVGIDSLVWGDLHDAQKDTADYKTSLNMLDELQPKNLVLHDIMDSYSVSHHDNGRNLLRASKYKHGSLDLYNELKMLGETMNEISQHGPKDMNIYVVKSNHDEHLEKYLDECRYVGDAHNLELSVRLANAMLEGKDPVEEGIKLTYGKVPRRVKFLQRDDEFSRYGVQLGFHGDKGPSGSRGSPISFEYSLGNAVLGHRHTPYIRKDVMGMGTLLRKDVDYAKGSMGSWVTSHAAVNHNGKKQLLNIHKGRYTI